MALLVCVSVSVCVNRLTIKLECKLCAFLRRLICVTLHTISIFACDSRMRPRCGLWNRNKVTIACRLCWKSFFMFVCDAELTPWHLPRKCLAPIGRRPQRKHNNVHYQIGQSFWPSPVRRWCLYFCLSFHKIITINYEFRLLHVVCRLPLVPHNRIHEVIYLTNWRQTQWTVTNLFFIKLLM